VTRFIVRRLLLSIPVLLGIVFVGEAIAGWATFERGRHPEVYEDEEEEAE